MVRETPGEPRSSHIVYGDNINWNNADYYKDTLWINESGDPDSYQPNNHGWFDVNSDQDFWLLYADHEVQSNKVLAPKLYIDWAATPERIQAACESIGITPPPEDLPAGVETENDFRNWVGQQVGGYVAYKLLTVPYNCDIFGHLLWNSDSAIPPYNTNIDIHVEWPAYSELEDEGRLYGVESYKGDWRIKIAGWGSVARHDLLSPCGAYLVNSTCMMGDQQNTPGDHYFPGTSNRVKATCSLPVITPDQEGRGRRPGHCGRYDGWAADIDYDGVADSAYTIRGEGFSGKWLDYDAKNLNNCADI